MGTASSAIMGIALTMTAAMAFIHTQKRTDDFLHAATNRMSREQLRNLIRNNINCNETISHVSSPCADGQVITIFQGRVTPTVLVATDPQAPSLLKNWGYVGRAVCAHSPNQFRIELHETSTSSNGDKKSEWVSLFEIPLACEG